MTPRLTEKCRNGWPSKLLNVPEKVKPYFTYRGELAVLDGIIYRGSRIVVPQSSRPHILAKLHVSHQGVAATLRRARAAVFWPDMANDIRTHIEKCVKCALDAPLQQKEQLYNHDIPSRVWSKVGLDILTHKGKDYLILVDYLSDFFECEPLRNADSKTVINACKKTFACYGIPDQVQSENGPQFTSSEFHQFGSEWGFQHSTSSPGYQQSNGKAKSAVKIIKRMMKRASDPYLALLEYRNTPTAGMSTSSAQRMLGRTTRSILPTESNEDSDARCGTILQEKQRKKLTVQTSHDKTARSMKPLAIGTAVMLRDFQSVKNKWRTGKVVDQLSDQSYAIVSEDTGNVVRRNRVDVRPIDENVGQNPNDFGTMNEPVQSTASLHAEATTPQSVTGGDVATATRDGILDDNDRTTQDDNPSIARDRGRRTPSMPVRFKDYEIY